MRPSQRIAMRNVMQGRTRGEEMHEAVKGKEEEKCKAEG